MTATYESYYDGKILYFPAIIPNIKELLKYIEDTSTPAIGEWKPWDAHDKVNPYQYGIMKSVERGKLNEETAEHREVVAEIINTLDTAIITGYSIYFKNLGMTEENLEKFNQFYWENRSPNFAIKKYLAGGHHGVHPDIDGQDPVGITTTLYLNDEYSGGEIYWTNIDVSIKPQGGSLVVFPSRAVHGSSHLTEGIKYFTNEVQVVSRKFISEQLPLWPENSWPI